jgi:hypothetical protein
VMPARRMVLPERIELSTSPLPRDNARSKPLKNLLVPCG